MATFVSGGTPDKAKSAFWDGDIPWVTVSDMKSLRLTEAQHKLTPAGAEQVRIVQKGTILVLVRGMGLFKDLPVLLCEEPLTFNQDIKGLVPNNSVDSEFLAYALIARKSEILRHVDSAGHGTGRLDTDLLKATPIPLPTLPEQRRIAEIIRAWDEAIEATQSIIAKRERQYRGLREQLVDWFSPERQPLRKLVKATSRQVVKPNEPYRALSIRSHGKGTFERLVSDPSSVAMEHLFVAKAGDLIVNITFAWEGAVALVPPRHDGGLVSHRFPTFEPRRARVNPRYLRHALRMPRFNYLLGVVSPGGAGRNRVLNKSDFLELDIPTPSLKAQDRVAEILDEAEKAIETEQLSLNALLRQKRGLMQKLLTGEWRVKPEVVTAMSG
ncbi:MAG: restriction endonuclease subunit S [Hyphomonas sp.]|nr:restriction endonuclease subunit S [Hyphomonas sp.]